MQLLMMLVALIAWNLGRWSREQRGRSDARHAPRKSTEPHEPSNLRPHDSLLQKGRMAVLTFSLTPEATGRIYEALVCLAKFGESVAIEARGDKVCLGRESTFHACHY